MKVGILTFHCAANYGAVLQCYGLQETLRKLGHEPYVLDYRPDYLTSQYKVFRDIPYNPAVFVKQIAKSFARYKRLHGFKVFEKEFLNIIPMSQAKDMDAIIVGSDQIWNPDITNIIDDTFLLNFDLPNNVRKIVYAASAGNAKGFKKNITSKQIKLLEQFDAISVRENELLIALKDCGIQNEIIEVLDPVLLAGPDIFEGLARKAKVPRSPYILTFSLEYAPSLLKIAQRTLSGQKLIQMMTYEDGVFYKDMICTASPSRFVSMIKHADGVVTTSFHGTAFSLMFNRPLFSVGYSEVHSKRAKNLLSITGFEDRFCMMNDINCKSNKIDLQIDYTLANIELEKRRQQSINFLKEALG